MHTNTRTHNRLPKHFAHRHCAISPFVNPSPVRFATIYALSSLGVVSDYISKHYLCKHTYSHFLLIKCMEIICVLLCAKLTEYDLSVSSNLVILVGRH